MKRLQIYRMLDDERPRMVQANGQVVDAEPSTTIPPITVAGGEAGQSPEGQAHPWFWEGEVQSRVVAHLTHQGWSIKRVADTASRETGRDIAAARGSDLLWVTVKGYPQGTERTSPSTQAGHWFKDALFDVIQWREQDSSVRIAVALPDRPRYQALAGRTTWFKRAADFAYLWVTEGDVRQE